MDPLHFTEEELVNLYEDLLALPPSEKSQPIATLEPVMQAQAEEDLAVVNQVDQRLLGSTEADEVAVESMNTHESLELSTQPYQRVISRAHDIVSRIETVRTSLNTQSDSKPTDVPITVLSIAESEALVRVCVCHPLCLQILFD